METRFEKRAVLVTGAASGIGLETTRAFASEGARVFAVDMNPTGAEQAADVLGSLASEVEFHVGDVSTSAACHQAVNSAVASMGRLDVLCNIAGFSEIERFTEISETQFQRMVSVNLGGVFFMTQAAMPHLIETGGNIVNMASVAGLVGNPYNSVYCATKGAVVNLTRALALEYSKQGVRVNCVCPGSVVTPAMHATVVPEGLDQELFSLMTPPLGHCQPDQIAHAVLHLASDAASYVTGSAYPVDGGRTAA